MAVSDYVPVVALLLVVGLIMFLQYQLGVRNSSVRSACILPVAYSVLFTVLTVIVAGWQTTALLFAGSQWVVGYWFYLLYEFGHRQARPTTPVTEHDYQLAPQKNSK